MKSYLSFLVLISLVSCGSKDNLGDFFSGKSLKSESKVTALFKAKTIAQKYGDGKYVTKLIKIPLTEDTILSYDLSDILDDETFAQRELGFFGNLKKRFKRFIYKAGVKLGLKSRVKYSTELSLEGLPLSILKSLKVKRVFFTLEDCHIDDEKCITRDEKKPVTFEFLDTFFLNASILKETDDQSFMIEEEARDKEGNLVLDERGVAKMARPYAFENLTPKEFKQLTEEAFKTEDAKEFRLMGSDDSQFYNLSLAKVQIDKRDYKIKDQALAYSGNTTLIIKTDTKDKDAISKIKDLLSSKKIESLVKDISLVGVNIFVELRDNVTQKMFFTAMDLSEKKNKIYGINTVDKCTNNKCINLQTDGRDLAPMLFQSELLRLDTFISLKKLEFNDFRYNGYVELELKLDLPL